MNRSATDPRPRRRGAAPVAARTALCAALALAAGGCVVTETVTPDTGAAAAERRALAAVQEVRFEGEVVGQVRRYGSSTSPRGHYYAVTNPWGQEVGMIDELGRVWRHRPHAEVPEALGSAPLAEGVRRLLGLPREPELVPVGAAG